MSNSTAVAVASPTSGSISPAFHKVTILMSSLGTLWILGLMFLIVADVLGRNFLDQPITGVAEIAGRSIVAIVFLQLPAAIANRHLTRSDFLILRIGRRFPWARWCLELAFTLISLAIFTVLTWAAWPEFKDAWAFGEFFGVQGIFTIPTWPFRGLLILGSFMAAVASVLLLKDQLMNPTFRSDVP